MYFTQTAAPNVWAVNLTVNGTQVGGAQNLTFSNTGAQTLPAGGGLDLRRIHPPDGGAGHEHEFQFRPDHSVSAAPSA